jgi:hypothetical protein
MTTPSPRAAAVLERRTRADLARRLAYAPIAANRLDPHVLTALDALGLVTHHGSSVQLNVGANQGSCIAALARGDMARAAGYARIKRRLRGAARSSER